MTRFFIVGFLVLWLPLQGYSAVAMPLCNRGASMETGVATAEASATASHLHESHDDGHSSPDGHYSGHQDHQSKNPAKEHAGLGCNGCEPCKLACAPVIGVVSADIVVLGSPVYDRPADIVLTSVSPDRLRRPPRAALS